MVKSIIALADIHLRPFKRHLEYKKAFNKVIEEVKDQRPSRVVIAGDLFHNKITISNEANSIMGKFLSGLAKFSKVIILPGNHDTIIGGSRLDSITPIVEILNNDNILYYKKSGCFEDKWDSDLVWCVWSCLEHQKDPEIKQWKNDNDPFNKKHYIGLYHGVVSGSTTDVGHVFTEGIELEDFKECDLIITGDIHKHQIFSIENEIEIDYKELEFYEKKGWEVVKESGKM